MKEIDIYNIRNPKKSNFKSYIFDKLTSLFILGKKNNPIKNPKKILFIRNDHIGDMVFATSVFRETKRAFPDSKITVIADKINKVIIEKDPNVDKIIVGERFWSKRTFKSFINYLSVLKEIRKQRFDVGVDLRRSRLNIFFYLFVPGIKNRVSYYNINGGKAFLTHPILYEKRINSSQDGIEMIKKAFGIKIKEIYPKVITNKEDDNIVNSFLKENNLKEYIILCPGATEETKRWPYKNCDEFIKIFNKKYPKYKILVAAGPDEKELVNSLCNNRKFCIPLIGFNLRTMCILIKNARALIANDGGIREIAWTCGGNVISLAGPLDLELHGPLRNSKIIHHKLPCYPCDSSKKCEKAFGEWCMNLITPKEVLQVFEEYLKLKK